MSNGLWPLLAEGASTGQVSGFAMTLLATGICVLGVWVFIRSVRPTKLSLRGMPGRPNSLHPLALLALYLLYLGAVLLAQTALAAIQGIELVKGVAPPKPILMPAMIVGHAVLIPGALALAAIGFPNGLRRGLGLSARRWRIDSARAVVATLAVWPVCVGLLALASWIIPPKPEHEHPILIAMRGASSLWLAVMVLTAAVIVPIGEELLFRGLAQSLLRRHFGPWPAVLIASAVFAVAHCTQPQAVPSLFVLAVVMGYNYERTGRLLAPMLIHALFNAANLAVSLSG